MKIPNWLMTLGRISAHCDDCGYTERLNISNMTEIEADSLLGKRCPKCGHVMLNANDIAELKKKLKTFTITEKSDEEIKNSWGVVRFRTKKH